MSKIRITSFKDYLAEETEDLNIWDLVAVGAIAAVGILIGAVFF